MITTEWIYENNSGNTHRYVLGTKGINPLICVGVNPSTASPNVLDRTMKNIEKVAINLGFDSYIMLNLYSQRATDPDEMDVEMNIKYNRQNFHWIDMVLEKRNLTIWAAWGTLIKKRKYLLDNLEVLVDIANKYDCKWIIKGKCSKDGHPHHPLYLGKDAQVQSFNIKSYISNLHSKRKTERLEPYIAADKIYFKSDGVNKLGVTDFNDILWKEIQNRKWFPTKGSNGEYKYIQSADKSLHQLVIDFYFGDETRSEFYSKGYIIEHLDNNGFNCEISNLYFLLKIKNTYKGWYFDKKVTESLLVIAMAIYHIIQDKAFQISIGFNAAFRNAKTGKFLERAYFLYAYDYPIVLQDAESMLEFIMEDKRFNIDEFKTRYRFTNYLIREKIDLELTEEEKDLPSGSPILRNGKVYIINRGEYDKFHLLKPGINNSWT